MNSCHEKDVRDRNRAGDRLDVRKTNGKGHLK
eukprot:gene22158-biopygen7820